MLAVAGDITHMQAMCNDYRPNRIAVIPVWPVVAEDTLNNNDTMLCPAPRVEAATVQDKCYSIQAMLCQCMTTKAVPYA